MKRIVFITAPDARYGFSLAGITHYITDVQEAETMLEEKIADHEIGLVIMDERLAVGIEEARFREIEKGWHDGVLLVLPSPEKPPEEIEDYATRLIRRAIGYHVRIQL